MNIVEVKFMGNKKEQDSDVNTDHVDISVSFKKC